VTPASALAIKRRYPGARSAPLRFSSLFNSSVSPRIAPYLGWVRVRIRTVRAPLFHKTPRRQTASETKLMITAATAAQL